MFKFAVQYVNLFTKPARWQVEVKPESDDWKDLDVKISDELHVASSQGKNEIVLDGLRYEILSRTRGARTWCSSAKRENFNIFSSSRFY